MESEIDKVECFKCGDLINTTDKHATFKEMSWHHDCFSCFNCSCSLETTLFSLSEDDELFCYNCYDLKYSFSCHQCANLIKLGDEKFVLGELYCHRSCFQCNSCETTLNPNSFWIHDDLHFCKNCYVDRFTDTCEKCNQKIMKDGIKYRDKHYHPNCFICKTCNENLVNKRFTYRDDCVYCHKCLAKKYSNRCLSCQQLNTVFDGEKMMSSGDLHWHEKCFYCDKCRQSLVGLSFNLNENVLSCPGCRK